MFTWAAPRFIDPAAPPTYDDEAFDKFVAGRGEIRVRVCKLFLKVHTWLAIYYLAG